MEALCRVVSIRDFGPISEKANVRVGGVGLSSHRICLDYYYYFCYYYYYYYYC